MQEPRALQQQGNHSHGDRPQQQHRFRPQQQSFHGHGQRWQSLRRSQTRDRRCRIQKRVPCEFRAKNLAVRVEESSRKPVYLAVKVLYQGGQTEIVGVDVARFGSSKWAFLSRNHGAVWETSRVPEGPLQFRFAVTGGFDGKLVWAQKAVLPGDWRPGMVYDTGLQITDIAQEPCSPCDDSTWK
ncbi:unnamed protein product [Linum tenue]|uniref:Expansin-like CBD domain-containing protein n=1 Tax=Linum tenue TaxID=586396 RepID=A0AAV0JD66_9ROSI|nr:unnamed protein product [Linum tenue]